MAKDTEDQIRQDYEGRLKQVIEGGRILDYSETQIRRMTERVIDKVYRGK